MQNDFTSIFTDKKGYGLSEYNEEVFMKEDEIYKILSRYQKNVKDIRFMPSESEGWKLFLKNVQ